MVHIPSRKGPLLTIPFDDDILVCNDTGLKPDEGIGNLEGGTGRKPCLRLLWVISEDYVMGHIEEHEGALIILEVLTESLVDTFFGHNRPVT